MGRSIRAAVLLCAAVVASIGSIGTSARATAKPRPQTRDLTELTAALTATEPTARARAACELRGLGEQAASAIEPLAALLADGSPVSAEVCVRWWGRRNDDHEATPGELAASALVAIGSRAYAALENALRSATWIARRNAAWALGALDDDRAAPRLIDALRDREAPVRRQAAWALGALDTRAAAAALINALKDSDAGVRQQAAWALGSIETREAVPALIAALKDTDARVRQQAAWALGVIGR